MEYANHLKEYAPAWSASQVDEEVARIRKAAEARNHNTEVYKFCYSAIDLTTLSCNDSVKSVTEFARKAAEFYQKYPHIPNVASICIYPSFVETVGLAVDGTPMKITMPSGFCRNSAKSPTLGIRPLYWPMIWSALIGSSSVLLASPFVR